MKKVYVFLVLLLIAGIAVPVGAYMVARSRSSAGDIVSHKWRTGNFPLVWRLNPTQGANITGTRPQADVFTATFGAWQGVSTAQVTFQRGADAPATAKAADYDNINVITTNPSGSEVPVGVLAYTYTFFIDEGSTVADEFGRPREFGGQIMEADMVFNPAYQFSTSTTAVADKIDLQSVATHEAGHFLGLDHASNVSSTMFWTLGAGFIYPRVLSTDDIAGISTLYPAPSFASKGKISGVVRTTANAPVYGAIVVAINASGAPAASTLTDPSGAYTIEGLDAGAYTVFAEPLSGRITAENIGSVSPLATVYPGNTVQTNFTTRFR